MRVTRTDWARSTFWQGYLTLTPLNNHTDLLQPYLSCLLSDRAGGRESRSIVMARCRPLCYEVTPVLPRPSMTRAAGGLVARRSDHGLSSRLSKIPVFF